MIPKAHRSVIGGFQLIELADARTFAHFCVLVRRSIALDVLVNKVCAGMSRL